MISWTIYDHPRDFPHCYVARAFSIDGNEEPTPTDSIIILPSLEAVDALRETFASMGLVRWPRQDDDDSVIMEVWL